MKQKYIEYPTFTSGEVLSKDLLDNLVGYDDEQSRLTRCKLIGSGIVEGLSYSFNAQNGVLTINPGTAVTNVGNMICINSPTDYYLYLNTGAPSMQEKYVFSRDAFLDLQRAYKLPENVVLTLKYEKKPVTSDVCSQNSCDMVHVKTHITITPVVYPKDVVEKAFIFPGMLPAWVAGKNFNEVLSCLNTNALHNTVKQICFTRAKGILEVMDKIDKMLCSQDDNLFSFIFRNRLARVRHWNNAVKRLKEIRNLGLSTKKSSGETPQYYLDFLEDVKEALEEFLDVYNQFVRRHRRVGHHYYVADDVVMLGRLGQSSFDSDSYRNYYEPALEDPAFTWETELVSLHLVRVAVMVEQFTGTSVQWNDIPCTLIPVEAHARLGERPIPFYYNLKGTQLLSVWDPYSCGKPVDQDRFTQSNCPSLDTSTSSYQLSGYYNKHVSAVLADLTWIIDACEYPVKVKRLGMFDGVFHSSKTATRYMERFRTLLQNFSVSAEFGERLAKRFPESKTRMLVESAIIQLGSNSFISRCLANESASLLCFEEAHKFLSSVPADQLLACLTDDDISRVLESGESVSVLKSAFRSAYSVFIQYVNTVADHLQEARFAKTRYVQKNDTIYLCCFNNRVIFYFSAPNLE